MMNGLFGKKAKVNVEIERKFLLLALPHEKAAKCHKIRQGYIARDGGNVVRIRQKDDAFILSVKTPTKGIGRYEIETNVTKEEAKVLFAACQQKPIVKTRKIYAVGDHLWEVDIFEGDNKGLIIAEIELAAENEKFILPQWVGPDVTGLQKFYNANLSQNSFKNWGVTYADLVARLDG